MKKIFTLMDVREAENLNEGIKRVSPRKSALIFLLKEIYVRHYSNRCPKCKKFVSAKQLTLEHILPQCAGGSNHFSNLTFLCEKCNNYKSIIDETKKVFTSPDLLDDFKNIKDYIKECRTDSSAADNFKDKQFKILKEIFIEGFKVEYLVVTNYKNANDRIRINDNWYYTAKSLIKWNNRPEKD